MDSDRAWEKWGALDPYFGVITSEQYRSENLTPEALEEFFHSGVEHVEYVIGTLRRVYSEDFTPISSLDFGCGVGRLLIPLARLSRRATGLDVSRLMLAEAKKNFTKLGIENVELLFSDDTLSCLEKRQYDLIHSFIVFQHIPIQRGVSIFKKLLTHVSPGGFLVVQFTYAKTIHSDNCGIAPPSNSLIKAAREFLHLGPQFPLRVKLWTKNMVSRRPAVPDPEMQMNSYPLNELFFLIQSVGAKSVHVDFTNHSGELGVFLFFQK